MKRISVDEFLSAVRERIRRFRSLPGVHLPLYESHACVDFGHYMCMVRSDAVWQACDPVPDGADCEAQALLAEHLAMSAQDVEELLAVCQRLRLENRLLRHWVSELRCTEKIDKHRSIA